MLTTGAMAAVSATAALLLALQASVLVAAAIGLLWGLAILNLDRWLVSSHVRHDRWYQNLAPLVPRLILAIVIGTVVATPLVLQIFRTEIEAELQTMQRERLASHDKLLSGDPRYADIPRLQQEINDLQGIVDGTASPRTVEDDPTVARLRAEYQTADARYQEAERVAQCELTGCPGSSGRLGAGPAYRAAKQRADQLLAERDRLKQQLDQAREAAAAELASAVEQERASAAGTLRADRARLAQLTAQRAAESDAFAAATANDRGLLARLEALERLTQRNPTLRTAYLALLAFLTLIEVLPVLTRFLLSTGPATAYDEILVAARRTDISIAEHDYRMRLRAAQAERVYGRVAGGRLDVEVLTVDLPRLRGGVIDDGPTLALPRSTPPSNDDEPARYLVADLPAQVQVRTEFSLLVHITTRTPAGHRFAEPMRGFAVSPSGVHVTITVLPGAGLIVDGDSRQTITVPYRGDPDPVRFDLWATGPGKPTVDVRAWVGGEPVGRVNVSLIAADYSKDRGRQHAAAKCGPIRDLPGRVGLQVHFDGSAYWFQLMAGSTTFDMVRGDKLTSDPQQAIGQTVDMLRKLAQKQHGFSSSNAQRFVRDTGQGLWDELIPPVVQDQFWSLQPEIEAFRIVSAEDNVPWELLYPTAGNTDRGFLVRQFPVTRHVFNEPSARGISLHPARFIVPPRAPGNAMAEVQAIHAIVEGRDEPPTIMRGSVELLDLIEEDERKGLLHFVCHNAFSSGEGGSRITMDDGPFIPGMLRTAVRQRRLEADRPLVFINACHSAARAPSYTKMMGWAEQFMKAGAGAFIGTQWPVRSSSASTFAEVFYAAMAGGKTLGEAARDAREAILDDADPTWLAYTAYGDPSATVNLTADQGAP